MYLFCGNAYLPKATRKSPSIRFVESTMDIVSMKWHSSIGNLWYGYATMKICRQRAGRQRRFSCCWIKRSLRTPLPFALLATWKWSTFKVKTFNTNLKRKHNSPHQYRWFSTSQCVSLSFRCHSTFHARGRPKTTQLEHIMKTAIWLSFNKSSTVNVS